MKSIVNDQQVVLRLHLMASWDPDEQVSLPDLTSQSRDKGLNFRAPHDVPNHAVISVSTALADTVSEVQRLNVVNEEVARMSSSLLASLQDDLVEECIANHPLLLA